MQRQLSVFKTHKSAMVRMFALRRAQATDANVRRLWMTDERGASASSFVIGIAVAALIVAIIVPIAFNQFFSVDTGSWDAQTILIWGIIPLVIILAIVLYFLNRASDEA